eukprot:scaffold567948_cov33-Prasinocladus_malaysianus.AAC.1
MADFGRSWAPWLALCIVCRCRRVVTVSAVACPVISQTNVETLQLQDESEILAHASPLPIASRLPIIQWQRSQL